MGPDKGMDLLSHLEALPVPCSALMSCRQVNTRHLITVRVSGPSGSSLVSWCPPKPTPYAGPVHGYSLTRSQQINGKEGDPEGPVQPSACVSMTHIFLSFWFLSQLVNFRTDNINVGAVGKDMKTNFCWTMPCNIFALFKE